MWIKRNSLTSIKEIVLANTGMSEEELLTPSKSYSIKGLDKAASMIRDAAANKTPISVVGDYDADGICASAIMWLTLRSIGVVPKIRIPRRFSEGYGLSENIIDELTVGLLITVDNGIVAHDAIKKAKDKGFTVIVTDHHLVEEGAELPPADIIINPHAVPDSADFNDYCGAGLAYKLAIELLGGAHPLIPTLNALAAIATVADVMPLIEENRSIVKKGIDALCGSGKTTGMAALMDVCGFSRYMTAKDLGFKIGPMLNAPGRLEDDGAMKSLRLLVFKGNYDKAMQMAQEIDAINEKRKELKTEGLEVLEGIIENECLFGEVPLCIYAPKLNEGLVGIYAGALAEKHQTPCFVFTDSEEEGLLKGSGRSYGGIHLKDLLDKNQEILYKYGGHAEAAGVSVWKSDFEIMKQMLQSSVDKMEAAPPQYYDLEITESQIPETLAELEKYAPYGEGNPEPVFYISDYKLSPTAQGFYKSLGSEGQHLKLFNSYANGIAFDMVSKYRNQGEPRVLEVYCSLSFNSFRGNKIPQAEMYDIIAGKIATKKTSFAAMLAKKAQEKNK